jgi:hypothetical protein
MNEKELAAAYQPLFDLMANEHELILTKQEIDEIIIAAEKVRDNISIALYPIRCNNYK